MKRKYFKYINRFSKLEINVFTDILVKENIHVITLICSINSDIEFMKLIYSKLSLKKKSLFVLSMMQKKDVISIKIIEYVEKYLEKKMDEYFKNVVKIDVSKNKEKVLKIMNDCDDDLIYILDEIKHSDSEVFKELLDNLKETKPEKFLGK